MKENNNNNSRVEWNGYCPKCSSDNIECTDENWNTSESFWECYDCGHTFITTNINVIDETMKK